MAGQSPRTLLKDEEDEDVFSFEYADEPEPVSVANDDAFSFEYADPDPVKPEPEPAEERGFVDSVVDRVADTGVDVLKGTIQLGQSIVGIGSLVTGGLVSKGMDALGYDPSESNRFLTDLYSDVRKEEEAEIEEAEGFVGAVKSYATNPLAAVGKAVETGPQMLGLVAVGKMFAAKVFSGAYKTAIAKGVATETAKKVALEASVSAATKASAFGEGAMQAGSSFDNYMDEGMELGKAYVASIGSGVTTGLTALFGGKLGNKIGLGDISAGTGSGQNFASQFLKGFIQEGALEEMPQSVTEQIWDNYAHDKPLMEGVEKAAGQGFAIGGLAGGAMNLGMGGQSDPNAPDQTPALFKPTNEINGQPVQQVTKRGEVVAGMFITEAGEIIREPTAAPPADYDSTMDVDAVAERIKADVVAANPYNLTEDVGMPTGIVGSQMAPAAETDAQATIDELDASVEGVVDPNSFEAGLEPEGAYEDPNSAEAGFQPEPTYMGPAIDSDPLTAEDTTIGADFTAEANTAATSPQNDLVEPTTGNKEAGNYSKGHAKVQGFNVSIENPEGSERKGTDRSGKEWSNVTTKGHYGYIRGTIGADSAADAMPHEIEQADVFVKPDTDIAADNPIYVIDQATDDGQTFDETKSMIGYASEDEAMTAYESNYDKDWKGLKAITQATPEEFKTWLADENANDEYSEYLKGTPKVLKPVEKAEAQTRMTIEELDAIADPNVPIAKMEEQESAYLDNLESQIKKDGMTNPIAVSTKDGKATKIEDGNHRLAVMHRLGMKDAAVREIDSEQAEVEAMAKDEYLAKGLTQAEAAAKSIGATREDLETIGEPVEKKEAHPRQDALKASQEALSDVVNGWEPSPEVAKEMAQRVKEEGAGAIPLPDRMSQRATAAQVGETSESGNPIPDAPPKGTPIAPVQDQSDPRLVKAQKDGFDTKATYYHSSKQDLHELNPRFDDGLTFLTSNPKFASDWTKRLPAGKSDPLGARQTGESGFDAARADSKAFSKTVDWERFEKSSESEMAADGKGDGGAYYKEVTNKRRKFSDMEGSVDSSLYPVYTSVKKTFDPRVNFKEVESVLASFPEEQGLGKLVKDGKHKRGNWIIYEKPEVVEHLKSLGYDSMLIAESAIEGEPHETLAIFDSKQVRSINAEFKDPSSNNLLARKSYVAGKKEKVDKGEYERVETEPVEDPDSDPYADLRGVDYTYQIRVRSTNQIHNMVADAGQVMTDYDLRVKALEELRACI